MVSQAATTAFFVLTASGAIAADVELGRYLATECVACHRASAADAAIPNIFGRPETLLADRLKAYRDKRLGNEVMQTVAGRLKDDEIAALAAYFHTTKNP